jgi:hypothetical protein
MTLPLVPSYLGFDLLLSRFELVLDARVQQVNRLLASRILLVLRPVELDESAHDSNDDVATMRLENLDETT